MNDSVDKAAPGPWSISKASVQHVLDENKQLIAVALGNHFESNARLIAAAPEMLSLLADAYSVISGYGNKPKLLGKIGKLVDRVDGDMDIKRKPR